MKPTPIAQRGILRLRMWILVFILRSIYSGKTQRHSLIQAYLTTLHFLEKKVNMLLQDTFEKGYLKKRR